MSKNRSMIFLIGFCVVILFLQGCAQITTPHSFKLVLYSDDSSSGGNRIYNINLTYFDDVLIYGWMHQEGGNHYGDYSFDCILSNITSGEWENETNGICYSPTVAPLNRTALVQMINSGDFIPRYRYLHRDFCYEIK